MTNGGQKINVLLADEQALFREATRVVLESRGDLKVVADAGDAYTCLAEADRTRPDVAFVSGGLAGSDGVKVAASIRERVPTCGVVVLAQSDDLEMLVAALEAGVSGYLTKDCPLTELVEAARAVARGETMVPKHMLGPLLGRLIRRRRQQDEAMMRIDLLTRREREILVLLAQGADNQTIAQALVISPETARTHIQKVLGKLGVHSRLEAAAFVVRNGILEELRGSSAGASGGLAAVLAAR